MEKVQTQPITESRRTFLKKVAYSAPAVIVLGALDAHADKGGIPNENSTKSKVKNK